MHLLPNTHQGSTTYNEFVPDTSAKELEDAFNSNFDDSGPDLFEDIGILGIDDCLSLPERALPASEPLDIFRVPKDVPLLQDVSELTDPSISNFSSQTPWTDDYTPTFPVL